MQDGNQVQNLFDNMKSDLNKAVDYLRAEYAVIRAGRANPHILDKIIVDYYGLPTPLNQIANMNVVEARLLAVNLYDITQIRNAVKAINEANLGVNVSDDGRVIRLVFPVLTEERRRDIVKQVKTLLENTKITMRNARRDCLDFFKQFKKDGNISEDDFTHYEKEVQKIVDSYMEKIDKIFENKEKEVMEV